MFKYHMLLSIILITIYIQDWIDHPEHKPRPSISAAGTSDKASYFKQRELEIKEREKSASEKKQQYLSGGMKYTAQAMAKMDQT